MNYSSTHGSWSFKKIGLFIVIIVAGFVAYNAFAADTPDATKPATSAGAGVIDKNLLTILDRIDSMKLDEKIFQDPAFLSLEDFTVTLVPEAVGRNNPFAPYSGSKTSTQTKKR